MTNGDDDRASGRIAIISAVKTPLGFFVLIALIIDGILLSTALISESIPFWAPLGLLAFLLAGFFLIVWRKPEVLYPPGEWPILKVLLVSLRFPVESYDVDLDVQKCILEVRDERGVIRYRDPPNLIMGHGGWAFRLTKDVKPSDSIRLDLVERNGRAWRVRPFTPYESNREAVLIGGGGGP